MAARQGCLCPGRGGGEGLREGSHLGWVPGVRQSRVGAGSRPRGWRQRRLLRVPGEAAMQTCPPPHVPSPASPTPPHPTPSAAEHRERPLLGGGEGKRKKEWGGTQGTREK